MSGIRAELSVDTQGACPVAEASASLEGPVTDVTWTAAVDGIVTEQFAADGDADLADSGGFETVFDYGKRRVYEFDREAGDPCVCEFVQETVGPVTSVHAREGRLYVTIHTADVEVLRGLVTSLRERYGDVSMEYLVQDCDGEDAALVPVDLSKLTTRQREVLETAYRMGYFEYPRGANATEVAGELGIDPSTFTEHLAAAQSKLLAELLPEPRHTK